MRVTETTKPEKVAKPKRVAKPEKVAKSETPELVAPPLAMQQLAALLVKHYGLHEGKFDLSVEFKIGVGAVGPSKNDVLPGAVVGVAKVGLAPSEEDGPMTVDAAVVNPPTSRARSGAGSK